MHRRQRITVSIIGIFIISLMLIGLTYGYYLTRIEGNTNTKSISVTTADLKLVYGDGNGDIEAKNIIPGQKISTKTFTVYNDGNATVNNYGVYLEEVVNNFTDKGKNDLTYKLSCTSNKSGKKCNGVNSGIFPSVDSLLISNSIDSKETQSYTLQVEYLETNKDQSNDMGKRIGGKIQIYDVNNAHTLSGKVSNANEGDYLIVESEPKKVQIVNNTFTVVGLEPGTHTITKFNKDGVEEASTSFKISKNDNNEVNNEIVNIDNNTKIIYANLDLSNMDLSLDLEGNPYSYNKNTLAYNIIDNALNNKNGTNYIDEPTEAININEYVEIVEENRVITDSTNYKNWTYYDDYTFDSSTGVFSVIGKNVGVNSAEEFVGKYLVSEGAGNVNPEFEDNLTIVRKVMGFNGSKLSVNWIRAEAANNQSFLSKHSDDYGTSFYYSGSVSNNYVNFAGMCWRILRIEGDGSVKLLLEDKNAECNSNSYTGDFNVGDSVFGYKTSAGIGMFEKHSTNGYLANTLKKSQSALNSKIKSTYGNFYNIQNVLKIENWCYRSNAYALETGGNMLEPKTLYPLMDSNTSKVYFDAYVRLYGTAMHGESDINVLLKCNGKTYYKYDDNTPIYVGTIDADETVLAGAQVNVSNNNLFIINDYQKNNQVIYHTMTPASYKDGSSQGFVIKPDGNLFGTTITKGSNYQLRATRPVVSLKPNTIISGGTGLKTEPYIISMN